MVETGRARRGRRPSQALPCVQAYVVVVAARRDEGRARSEPLHELEAEDAAIEPQRPLEVGDLEMNVSDPRLGMDWAGFGGGRHGDGPKSSPFVPRLQPRPPFRPPGNGQFWLNS